MTLSRYGRPSGKAHWCAQALASWLRFHAGEGQIAAQYCADGYVFFYQKRWSAGAGYWVAFTWRQREETLPHEHGEPFPHQHGLIVEALSIWGYQVHYQPEAFSFRSRPAPIITDDEANTFLFGEEE